MSSSETVSRLIQSGSDTILGVSDAFSDDRFLGRGLEEATPMGWTLLHLTGQLEWAVEQTTGEKSVHDVSLLEQVKGGESVAAFSDLGISRDRITSMYRESVSRALKAVENSCDRWSEDPKDLEVREVFGTVGAIWEAVSWHAFWHLGESSAMFPEEATRDRTHPRGPYIGTLSSE